MKLTYSDLNRLQVDNIRCALGLNYQKTPYRNRYCTGQAPELNWDKLCLKGLAWRRVSQAGRRNYYYHISRKGLEFVLENAALFGLDKRIKSVDTLDRKVNE